MMLKKKSNPWARAKVLFAIPVAIAGIAVFSCSESASVSDQISECKVSEIFGNDQGNESKNAEITILINAESMILFNESVIKVEDIPALLKKNNANADTKVLVVSDRETPMSIVSQVKNALREGGIQKLTYGTTSGNETVSEMPLSELDEQKEKAEGNQVFTICEVQPKFPGGEQAMMEHLKNNLRYPAECADKSIEGRVILSFVVEKDGSVSNIEEMRSPDPLLTKEAKRVVSIMPKWEPGTQRGHKVRVKYVLPITFRLK